jgi:hypothetical protein
MQDFAGQAKASNEKRIGLKQQLNLGLALRLDDPAGTDGRFIRL